MTEPKPVAFDWGQLTDLDAAILEGYFALYQQREPATIGSGEILAWFRQQGRIAPSEAQIRTVLGGLQVPRRSGGRPANDSRAPLSPPLPPTRTQAPRTRRSPPR